MKNKNGKKLSILAIAGLTCLIPGLIVGCGNKNSDTDLFFTRGIKVTCGESLTTLNVDGAKLKDGSGNYYLFLKNEAGEAVDLSETGSHEVVNPTVAPKNGTEDYFLRVKIQYLGITGSKVKEIEDVDDYFTVVPTFSNEWLLCDDGYYYNVKDGVVEWNRENKSSQLKVGNGNSQQIALFGSNSRSYAVSESAYISYSYIGARVIVEAVNSKGATDSSLASQGWTFQTNKTTGLKLTYDMNGGTESELSPIENLREGSKVAISSTIPTRTGYTFVGWNTSSTGNGKSYEAGAKVKIGQTDLTLYAEWKANTYNAQFDTNGGSFTPGETALTEYTYGKEVNLPTPVKEGYTFDGWYDADGNRVAFITKTTIGDLSLTAKWSLKKYKITLNENYGTMEYSIEQGAILPTDIKKEGYTFDGWYESYTPATGSEPEKWEGKRTEVANTEKGNKSFYAKWTIKSYLIHLDLQDGILYGENIDGQTKEFGSALPTRLEKDGYIFNDWAISAQGGETYTSVGDFGDVSEITLYAQWIPKKMNIIFNSNGGTIDDSTQEVVKMVGFNSEIGELPVPSRLGYAFRGWFIDRYFSGEALTEDSIWLEYSTTRVYAKWEALPTPYTVEYYLEGYDGTFVKHLVENKTALTDSAVSVEIKSFSGFEHNENDNDILQGTVAPDGSLLLKIYYTRKYFSISYELDGGSFGSEEVKTSYRYGDVYEFPAVSKHGYRFLGWYKDAEFTGNAVTGITSEDVGNIVFYAKFDQILFNVKLNMLGGSLKENETDVTEHTYGNETKLPILEREGCEFGGWYDNAEFNGDAIEVIPAEVKCDTEYFAKWIGLENPVSFVTNGGTIQSNWISTYTTLGVTELPIVTRLGYKFLGWYDNAEFEGRCYEAITEEVIGEMTFYAKWGDGKITFSVEGPTGVSLKNVDLPTAYTNSEHAETYTIPSLRDIIGNNKNLAVRYVKVNDSGARNKVGSTFALYGDTKITFVYDYVTDLIIKELVNEEGQTIIEATTIRQWGEGASLKFILPEPQDYNYYNISWTDRNKTIYGVTSYTTSTYGIKVTLTPAYIDLDGEGAYVIPDNKTYKLKTKNGISNFNGYGYNPVLLRVTEGENNFYAPDCRVIEDYRFLGWLKTFNGELSDIYDLIQPGDIITFDVDNDELIGFWEYDTYTITIDLDGGEIFDMYSREKISTEFENSDSDFMISGYHRIGGYKFIDGEKYILGGFEIVSPVDYEELGYEISFSFYGIRIERKNENGERIRFGNDFKIKAIWINDYMNQKIKINRKAGEHVYLDGKEVSELTYDGILWSDEFRISDESIEYLQRLTFKKDGENCIGRLIITTKDGLRVGEISEGLDERGFLAFPGGLIGEIEWIKAYTARVEKGSIPGVEITGEDVYLTYDESDPSSVFDLQEYCTNREVQGLTGFYYAEGYYCDGFKGYTIDTNEEVTEENIREHLGNVYFVPVWKKIEGSFNPGSIVENGETIKAVMKSSFMTDPINEFYLSDGYLFGSSQLLDCLEIPKYPNYRIAGVNINGKDYVNLERVGTIYWKEAKYLVKSDESGDTYIYLTEDSSYDPEIGDRITTLTGKFKLIKDGKVIEEDDLEIECVESPSGRWYSYYVIKKEDGTVLAYRVYDCIYSGLRPSRYSDITVDESSKITLSTDVNESDSYYTYFKQHCYDGGYSEYYDLGGGYRYACGVEENGYKHEFLMWKEGEDINGSNPDYGGYSGGARVLYTQINEEEKIFNFFKYNDEFYSVGKFSQYEGDGEELQGESTIFEQDITVLWTKDYACEVKDKEEFESTEEEEEAINAVHQEMQNLRNIKEKYSEKYISGYQFETATGTILEGGNTTILSAFNGDMSVIMTSPKETGILLLYMNMLFKYAETKTTKSTEVTVDGVSYSWTIVGDEVRLTNEGTTITSVNKVLEINGKTYTADFSLLGLELKAEDGTAVIGHAYFSVVSYAYGYDVYMHRYELYRKNGEDYISKISCIAGFVNNTPQTFVYEILDGPMPEE